MFVTSGVKLISCKFTLVFQEKINPSENIKGECTSKKVIQELQ